MIEFSFKIEGYKELEKALEEMPTKADIRGVIRSGMKDALRQTEGLAKTYCPSNRVRKSIGIFTKLKDSQKRMNRADPNYVTAYLSATSPLAHLIEFGTTKRFTKKTKRYRGKITPNPFMRKAWDETKMSVSRNAKDYILARALTRMNKILKSLEKGTLGRRTYRGLLDRK
jgi:hypothetical protein